MSKIEALQQELRGLDAQIEAASVAEDEGAYVRAMMRRTALPVLIREARMAPFCRQIERMEHELRALEEEAQSVQEAPLPVVPPGQRGHVTPVMLRNAELGDVNDRASRVGRELRAKRGELRRIETESPPPLK